MATVTDVTAVQLEVVAKDLESFFKDTPEVIGVIDVAKDAIQVSRFLCRIPFKQYNGGNMAKIVGNQGSRGVGTGMKTGYLTAGYFYSNHAFRVPNESIDTTQNTKQAIINVLSDQIAHAMEAAQLDADIAFHTDGTGILTNPCSAHTAGPPGTMTFAGATDFVGINRLREGMCVDVWNAAGTVKRVPATAAPIIIVSIDYGNKVVTFDQAVTALADTDIIAFRNMDAYGPASLTSFSSTWPAGATNGPGGSSGPTGGLGGDSFRHGLYYANDNTTSHYYLGVLKSTVPQLLPSSVNALSSGLTFGHGLLLKDQLRQRWNREMANSLLGIAHMAQRTQVWQLGYAISTKMITGAAFGNITDLAPKNDDTRDVFDFCDIKCHISARQDKSRFDFINPKKWSRVQLFDTRFANTDGRRIYEGRGSDGTVQTYLEFFIEQSFDFVCRSPGAEGYIYNLALPTNY